MFALCGFLKTCNESEYIWIHFTFFNCDSAHLTSNLCQLLLTTAPFKGGGVGGIVSMNATKTPEFNIQIEEKNRLWSRLRP